MNTAWFKVLTRASWLVAGVLLLAPLALKAQVPRTWVGTSVDMNVATNWTPEGVPSATAGDSLVFDGSSAFNAITFPYNVFNANNGLGDITVTAGQASNLTITCTGAPTGGNNVFRLLPGKTLSVAAGAGAFAWGASGGTFLINLGQNVIGNTFINDSAYLARIGSRASLNVTGGPGGRAIFGGSGDWLVDANFTASVNLGLFKTGAGTLTLAAANSLGGASAVSNGTLRITHTNALGTGAFTVMDDAVLDLTGLPDGATVTNTITGSGQLRVRGCQNITLDNLAPAGLTLQTDVAGLSLGAHTVLRKAGTTFAPASFAAYEYLNADGTTVSWVYDTVGQLQLSVDALPAAVAWDGGSSADSLWNTPENWSSDALPVAWSRLAFSGASTPRATNTNDIASAKLHSVGLADQNWNVSGQALTLGRLELTTAHAVTVGTPLTFTGEAVADAVSGGTLTVSGSITGERTLTKSGPGTLTLMANNSYSGGTLVWAGTVQAGNNNALGSGPATFASNADLEARISPLNLPNRVAVPTGVTARLRRSPASTTVYLSGGLSGGGTLEIGGQFTSTEFGTRLNGDNSGFTGTVRVGAYTELRVEDSNTPAGSLLPNGTLELNGGNVLIDVDSDRTFQIGNLTTANLASNSMPTIRSNRNRTHTLSVGGLNQDGHFGGALFQRVGTLALTKVGSGTLTLSGLCAYSGATTVQGGTLRFDRTAAVPEPLGYWPMNEGSGSIISNTVAGSPDGGLTNGPAWITGPGGAGTSAVYFSGTNQWGAIPLAGHPLNDVGTSTLTVCAWVKTATAGVWYRSLVSKFDDRGTTPFWGLGWFSTSQLGMVARAPTGGQMAAHTGAAALDNVWHYLVGVREADNTLRVYLDGSLYASAVGPTGVCRDDRSLWICRHGAVNQCVSAGVAGIGVWTEALSADQVRALHAASQPLASAVRVAAGAAVQFAGGKQEIGSLADQGASGGSVVLEGAALTVGRNGTSTAFSGVISGTGLLAKTGAGTLTLSGSCDLAGNLTVGEGTLALSATGSLGDSVTNIVVNGGTLSVSNSAAINDMAVVFIGGTGTVDLAAGVDEVVGALVLEALRQPPGTYGSGASPAQFKNDTWFTGAGVLRMIPGGTLILVQ